MPLAAGTRFGPYEILSLIGAGGMGEVYCARDTKLKRDVALKVLPTGFSSDSDRMGRFQREAEVLASLDHPNIGPIFGMVESDGVRALALALVEGPTLAERIAAGALPVEEATAVAKQIIAALEYAHERGVIHRDLKPANIKITPDGAVRVLDFGLAKVLDDDQPATPGVDSPTLTLGHTRAGVILGTAAYMSPEQAVGKKADRRSDIFSFGSLLYEMLTSERAFKGDSSGEMLVAVAKDEPEWSKLPAGLPSAIEKVLRRCLVKDRKQRLQAIGEARILLESPEEPPAHIPTVPPSRAHRFVYISGSLAVSLVALATLAFVHFRETPPVAQIVRFQVQAPEKGPFAQAVPAVSPDGRRLAFLAGGPAGGIWVRSLDTLEARPLAGTEGGAINTSTLFWSPDSRFIAFEQLGNKLRKVDASGGPAQAVLDLPAASRGGAWNRDGVIVFGTGSSGLLRVPEAGGAAVALTKLDASRAELFHGYPSFLAHSRRFVYYRYSGSPEIRGIYLGSLDLQPEQQSSKRLVATDSMAVYAPPPEPDRPNASSSSSTGYLLFLRGESLVAQPFDARRGELAGEAFPVAEGVGTNLLLTGFFSVSTTGVLAYRSGANAGATTTQLTWFDRAGKNLGVAGEPSQYNVVSLSPDGTRAAVMRADPSAGSRGNTDVWVHDLARSTTTRLTFDPDPDGWPAWSPDGSRIAFSSQRGGAFNLYRKDASGAGNDELLLKSNEQKFVQDWSRDGNFLIYSQTGTGGMDLSVLPLDGPEGAPKAPVPYLKTEFFESEGRFSPDGRFVAYNSNESGRTEIYVQPFPDPSKGKWQISRGGGVHPRWRRDGGELFYISADSKMMAVDVSLTPAFKAGVPKALFPAPIWGGVSATNVTRYDVTADGRKFLINLAPAEATGAPPVPITVVLNWQAGLKK